MLSHMKVSPGFGVKFTNQLRSFSSSRVCSILDDNVTFQPLRDDSHTSKSNQVPWWHFFLDILSPFSYFQPTGERVLTRLVVQCEKAHETNADFHVLPSWGWCDCNKASKARVKKPTWPTSAVMASDSIPISECGREKPITFVRCRGTVLMRSGPSKLSGVKQRVILSWRASGSLQ